MESRQLRCGRFLVLVAIVFPAVLCSCDRAKGPAGGVAFTLDWKPEPEFGGFYAAQLSGAFLRNGLNVTLSSAGGGAATWQLVDRGQADFATTSADQVLIARAAGADVIAIFAVYQTNPQGIMTHSQRGFQTLADVFAAPGVLAAENNAWLQYLRTQLKPVNVKITGYSGGIAAFMAKQDYSQQCFITSEPILARRQGAEPRTFLIADSGYNPYATVVITRGGLLRDHPARVKAMANAVREGWLDYLKNPQAANAHMATLNKDMDSQTFADGAAAQAPLIRSEGSLLGVMTTERWETLARQLVSLGILSTAPPAQQCFINP